jgi:hypothetical protein
MARVLQMGYCVSSKIKISREVKIQQNKAQQENS